MVRQKAWTAWRLLQNNPREFLGSIARIDAFHIFSERPDRVPLPLPSPDVRIVKLTNEQMLNLPPGWEQQTKRFLRYGFHSAYGAYVGDTLAHMNWLITAEQDCLRRDRVLKLSVGEAEIAHTYTAPEFRRRGLQLLTIRELARVASEKGIGRLYSITLSENTISMRGITSAGLRHYARAYRLVVAPNHAPVHIVIRGHRIPWNLLLKSNPECVKLFNMTATLF